MDKNLVESENVNANGYINKTYLSLCPLDGRYDYISNSFAPYFSEYALMKYRIKVEVLWLKFLIENVSCCDILRKFDKKKIPLILSIYDNFSENDYIRIKEIENTINHDTKAVELFIVSRLKEMDVKELVSFVHIGCTSEDITNSSYALMISNALNEVWLPFSNKLVSVLYNLTMEYKDVPMLSHTHGQPATPTTVGKEFAVYVYRMRKVLENIKSASIVAKFNGVTGNYAAISLIFPDIDWINASKVFVEKYLGFDFNLMTTQIENHDYICDLADKIRHFNNILLDFDTDMWLYIGKGYFQQKNIEKEIGSSTMPHKINPINFENSESNIEMSNSILMLLSNRLSHSRMQRDLVDSSLKRNIGLAFGYSLQAIEQTIKGLEKVTIDKEIILDQLDKNWQVLAEPIQTMLRKYGINDAYEQLKVLTRGAKATKNDLQDFIMSLEFLSDSDRDILLNLTPSNYVGYASKIVSDKL